MWNRIFRMAPIVANGQTGESSRRAARSKRRPIMESLETRQLLTASLAPIADVTAPVGQGYQLTLDGSGTTSPRQIFTASSDNPNIKVNVAQGQFWTINVQHLADGPDDVTIMNEPMTFQFFPEVAPNTVERITNFSNTGYYTTTGRFFPRILSGFVAQGGSNSPTSTASQSGVPPIGIEVAPQVAFNSFAQLAMANTGAPNSSDAQFFITFGPQTSLNYNYTIFGQQVAGLDTLAKLSQVQVHSNGANPPEISVPDNPVTITGSFISDTNPNGALSIDTTAAGPGEKANIQVIATDPTDGSTAVQTFTVYTPADTGTVRQINNVLIATPKPQPRNFRGTNTIEVRQAPAPTIPPSERLQVYVNGVLDSNQPDPNSLVQLVVAGSKANDKLTISNDVTVPATLSGGMAGRRNVVTAGGGYSIVHGWFGHNTLVGGEGPNILIGRENRARFRPSPSTLQVFAGEARGHSTNGQPRRPIGTYYRFVNGHLVPVSQLKP